MAAEAPSGERGITTTTLAAQKIRNTVQALASEMRGFFPVSYQNGRPMELAAVEMGGGRKSVLTQDFRLGARNPSGDFSLLDDLAVVENSPSIFAALLSRIGQETSEYSEEARIRRAMEMLEKGTGLYGDVIQATKEVAELPGKDDPENEILKTKLEIARFNDALDVYRERNTLPDKIQQIADRNPEVLPEIFAGMISSYSRLGLDGIARTAGGEAFYVPRRMTEGGKLSQNLNPINTAHYPDRFSLAVSEDGSVGEIIYLNPSVPARKCEEGHPAQNAKSIAEGLIGAAVGNVFPNLPW